MKKLFSKSWSAVEGTSLCLNEKDKDRDKEEYVAELEDIIEKVTILYSKKDEMVEITYRAMLNAKSREKLKEYIYLMREMKGFWYEYEKFIKKYQSETARNAGSGTGGIKLSTLAKLIRDARSLQGHHISLIIERINKILADREHETLKERIAFLDFIANMSRCSIKPETRPISSSSSSSHGEIQQQQQQQCNNAFVPEKKHYLFALKGNDIELELDHHTILVHLEGSGEERVINLVEQNLEELPEGPEYHYASVLFLQRNNGLSSIGSSFFDRMPELCFLDLSDTRIRILPNSIFRLSKLKVLLLRNCVSLKDLPAEVENLKKLQVLDLSGSPQDYVPVQMGKLNRLRHLQLSIYGDDEEYPFLPPGPMIPRGIFSEFKDLEALSITVLPEGYRWHKNTAECILKDLVTLKRLVFLQLHFIVELDFQSFIRRSLSWSSGRLTNFKFIVGFTSYRGLNIVPCELELLFDECNRCLRLVKCHNISEEMKNVLVHTTAFYLDSHMEIQSFSEFGNSNFRFLKLCLLRECPKLGVIFENKENDHQSAFECLEYLGLYGLWKLEHIWKTPLTYYRSFKALKNLTVSNCPELRFILMESMIECLSNLEELVVNLCNSVETIVKDDTEKKMTTNKNNDIMVLPRLRIVVLDILPNLVSLGNGLCPTKQIITIVGCEKLILNSYQQPKK